MVRMRFRMGRRARRLRFLSLSLSLTAAATSQLAALPAGARSLEAISQQQALARAAELRMTVAQFAARPTETIEAEYDECSERSFNLPVAFPADGERTGPVPMSLWVPAPIERPVPAVVIVPTLEGHGIIENRTAYWACTLGILAIIADVNDASLPKRFPDWQLEDRRNRNSIVALQTALDWAASDPRVDPSKLGAIGISLGGILTGLWLGVDPRLKAAMLVVSGGNIPEILSLSTQRQVAELRAKRMSAASLTTVAQYEDALRPAVRYDPFYLAPLARAALKMVAADEDFAVPSGAQDTLWQAFGKPERLLMSGGHVETIVSWAYLHMGESIAWMHKQLGSEPTRVRPMMTTGLGEGQ